MIFFLLKIDYHFLDQIFASVENFCVTKRKTLRIVTLEIRLIYLLRLLTDQCKKHRLQTGSKIQNADQRRFQFIYMLFTGREVRIGKNCTRDRGHSFSQYGPTKAGE